MYWTPGFEYICIGYRPASNGRLINLRLYCCSPNHCALRKNLRTLYDGSVIAFVLGYCSMFFKSGVLREVYPFLASLTVIGFDTASYINAESQSSILMGMLSLGAMLLISALLIASAKTPGETKARYGKGNISLRPAQRKRLEGNKH